MQSLIRRNGHRLLLTPEQLENLTHISAPRITPCNDGGVCVTSESLLHDGVASLPNVGLQRHIKRELEKQGHSMQQVSSVAFASLKDPIVDAQSAYPSLLHFVKDNVVGLIDARNDFDVDVAAIAALANGYPAKRIMVVGARKSRLQRIWKKLRSDFGLPARFKTGRTNSLANDFQGNAQNLIVTTFFGAAECDLPHCDLVILADAEECSHKHATVMLSQVDARFRLFGLLRRKGFHSQPPSTRADLMRVFGVNWISLRSNNRVRVDCELNWIQNRQNFIKLDDSDAELHRTAIWHNRRRNQAIKLAALRVSDELQHAVILVKTLQHASALSYRMPNWQVRIADSEVRESKLMNRRFQIKAKTLSQDWLGAKAIMTTACAALYPGFIARNVVWAGSGAEPEIPLFWLYRKDDDISRPLRIIDFADSYNKVTSRFAERRQEWYRLQSIEIRESIKLEER